MEVKKMTLFANFVNENSKHNHRSYINSSVRFHHPFTFEDRLRAALSVGWNVFDFPAEYTLVDLLSDSGTGAMTVKQFASMFEADEAYGTNWGSCLLLETVERIFGINVIGKSPEWETYGFHQCRAAEHAFFTQIGKDKSGLVIPSNGHFDTTRANIEANGLIALDVPSCEKPNFRGNMDISALELLLSTKDVPLVFCTITNNTMAGQPVSLENIENISRLCNKANKAFFLDACRFAENAWFIKKFEHPEMTIPEIVLKMFSFCDGFTISYKKDGLANMGGGLYIKKASPLPKRYPNILEDLRDHQICVEGHKSYFGMSGRDIMTVHTGLPTVVTQEYLDGRIGQVHRFGEYMMELGLPVVEPFGGHAVYLDMDKFYEGTKMDRKDFGGISLTSLLLLSGPRLCELGAFAFGRFDGKKEIFPPFNYVRCAVPRLKYEIEDLYFVADCVKYLHDRRDTIPKAVPIFGQEKALRHMKARFELVSR